MRISAVDDNDDEDAEKDLHQRSSDDTVGIVRILNIDVSRRIVAVVRRR